MVSRCPSCKTHERIVSVRTQATARCNSCGDCQIISKAQPKQSRLHRRHYHAALLAACSLSVLVLLVKVAHALP